MIKRGIFLIGLIAICSAFKVSDKVMKKADKVIAKFYETPEFSKETISISAAANDETSSEFGEGNLFKITQGETMLGYGYIGPAPSKTSTFEYLVLFDADYIVTKSKVLIYREEYGGEIGSKRWLKQFTGTSSSTHELKYEEDIIPISGATISVRSMTRAMNDLLRSIGTLKELNEI